MGMEIYQVEPSHILGKYVGENEENIARAFEYAASRGLFLLFNEGDTYLSDRTKHERTWETSTVNQMLNCMEHHPLPFAVTTNTFDALDSAGKSRFSLTVGFDFLSPEQTAAAFQRFFKMESPDDIGKLTRLAPRDFTQVRRQATVLGKLDNPEWLRQALSTLDENKPKHEKPRNQSDFGFARSGLKNQGLSGLAGSAAQIVKG